MVEQFFGLNLVVHRHFQQVRGGLVRSLVHHARRFARNRLSSFVSIRHDKHSGLVLLLKKRFGNEDSWLVFW